MLRAIAARSIPRHILPDLAVDNNTTENNFAWPRNFKRLRIQIERFTAIHKAFISRTCQRCNVPVTLE
jgi:hypothetical protein